MKTWKKPEVSKTSINMIEECLTAEELSETNGGTPFVGACFLVGVGGDWDTGDIVKVPGFCYIVGA